jgi:hypothetical protein
LASAFAALGRDRVTRAKDRDPAAFTLGLAVAVLSGRHPGQDPFAGRNPEAAAGDVLPIHDPGHFCHRLRSFSCNKAGNDRILHFQEAAPVTSATLFSKDRRDWILLM